MILGQQHLGPEGDAYNTEDCDLKKQAKVTLDKRVSERLVGATQQHTQFQGTEIKGRRGSDHMRQREKQRTLENWDRPSIFTWARRYH